MAAAAASCNVRLLPFSKNHDLRRISSSFFSFRPFAPSSSAAIRPSSPPLLSASADRTGGISVEPVELVANPALRHANVLFFKSGYNVQIVVEENEPEEVLLRRFRREVSRAGVIQECKRRRFFENKQEEKKRKAREAGRRNRRRRLGPRFNSSSSSSSTADTAPKARDDVDDNWDMPVGDSPY